jgi:L-ascorbate metabolism protein UlaG (beta-lactamase superfamily)
MGIKSIKFDIIGLEGGRMVIKKILGYSKLKGTTSDHFDGKVFTNKGRRAGKTITEIVRWQRTRKPKPWPEWVENHSKPQLPSVVAEDQMAITFINHSSFLVQFAGLNVLTDPVYSERVSPFQNIGPRRVRAPGLPFEELPNIDIVLLSHNHYDHLDIATLKRLAKRHAPLVITGLGNGSFLAKHGITHVVELDWWEAKQQGDALVTLTPALHWSGRGIRGKNRALWGGFVIQLGGLQFFFAGDTGLGPHFGEIRDRFGEMDVALLPIGAYEPRWFTWEQHMNPDDAVLAHIDLGARLSIGTHFGCFQLTDEGFDEPVRDLGIAREKYSVDQHRFQVLEVGETKLFSDAIY